MGFFVYPAFSYFLGKLAMGKTGYLAFLTRPCNRYEFPTVCVITDKACMVHSDQRPAEVLVIFLFQQMFWETGGNFVSRSALVS